MADVADHKPATAETLFRIGSVSKAFAAMAALQLQEEGKLKITDTVKQWVPDVAFDNPWEATDPVRLVHLMEHTTGFDDIHMREYALNDPTPIRLEGRAGFWRFLASIALGTGHANVLLQFRASRSGGGHRKSFRATLRGLCAGTFF